MRCAEQFLEVLVPEGQLAVTPEKHATVTVTLRAWLSQEEMQKYEGAALRALLIDRLRMRIGDKVRSIEEARRAWLTERKTCQR